MRRLMAVMMVVALATAACGNGGDSEEDLIAALTTALSEDADPGNPLTGTGVARCFAEEIVGNFGVDRLNEIGVTANDVGTPEEAVAQLTDGERTVFADSAIGCIDVTALLTAEFVEEGISPEASECIAEEVKDLEIVNQMFTAGVLGMPEDPTLGDQMEAAFIPAALKCMSPEELAGLEE